MNLAELFNQLVDGLQRTTLLEFIAVIAGVVSVWFSRKENILVYPVGLINTILYVYINAKGDLLGEASVNLYYTLMSIYGWWLWSRKDEQNQTVVIVKHSNGREWIIQIAFFATLYAGIYVALIFLKNRFADGAIPAADAFASASAFTAMWLMAKKKVESWYWWIATNIASIPLYFVKGLVFTSLQFLVLLVLAVAGLISWRQKAKYARS